MGIIKFDVDIGTWIFPISAVYTDDISKVIQQKIDALKADGRTEEC
jgi:hypothetical protein